MKARMVLALIASVFSVKAALIPPLFPATARSTEVGQATVESYGPATDTWSGNTVPTPRSGLAGASANTVEAVAPPGMTLTTLGLSRMWLGLINSDDQGTRFDLRIEVYKNNSLVASGLTRCINGVTRNPNRALEVMGHFDPFPPTTYNSGDVFALQVVTRIGTNSNDTKCTGHNNAVGLRLYYDAISRQSLFAAELSPNLPTDFSCTRQVLPIF